MITTRFYLDCRAVSPGQAAPLRLVITKKSVRTYIPLSLKLLPIHWDRRRQIVIGHPRKVELNNLIQNQKLEVESIILRLIASGDASSLSAAQIKQRVMTEIFQFEEEQDCASPYSCFQSFIDSKTGRTRKLYEITLKRLQAFCPTFSKLKFEDITPRWLDSFDSFMSKTAPSKNARNIHLRNLRAVFNRAIDDELTQCYPFRKFKIKNIKTRKRSLTVIQLRKLFTIKLESKKQRYLDFFKLSFMLCGINVVDLCLAAKPVNGRFEYERAKTHRLYSIKIEPEADAYISKYTGNERAVNFSEKCKSYLSFYKHLGEVLREVGISIGVSGLSSYWARHSWATIAASLDIPKETISAALGHGGNTVTDIYIDFEQSKVDDANRKVLDWVLYGRK